MKKKILALILAMIMVLGGTGILEVRAEVTSKDIQNAVVMSLNTTHSVNLEKGDDVCFEFTPDADGVYKFESKNQNSAVIELYDSANEIRGIARGKGSSCYIQCILDAGKTYYLKGWIEEYKEGEISLLVSNKENISWYLDSYKEPIIKYGETKDLIVRAWTDLEVSYQWYYQDADYQWVLIEGATDNTYTVTGNREMYSGYKCTVSATDGTRSSYQIIYPEFYTGLELEKEYEEVVVKYGETKDLTVKASGGAGELSYQWYKFDEEYNAYIIEGATSDTLRLNGTLDIMPYYACEVTDGVIKLGFFADVYLDTGLRTDEFYKYESFVYGKENVMTMSASGGIGELSYQWYAEGDKINGATEDTLTITGEEGDYTYYGCEVTDGILRMYTDFYIEWDTGIEIKEDEINYIDLPENVSKTLTVNATGGVGNLSYLWRYYVESGNYWSGLSSSTNPSYTVTADANMKKKIKCKVKDSLSEKEVIYELNKVPCTDISIDEDNFLTENKMFYKISGIEGAQSFSFTNTDTSYEQKLKLYDEEVNVIVDANSDKLAYIFDAEKTYYLYAYSEAVGESDTTTAIRCEEVDFYAVADGDAEVEVLYNAEHTMRVTAMTEAGELSYQWYYLDENGDDSIINVETNDTLTITANEDAHRNYLCKVSNGDETVDVCFVINIDTGLKTTIIPYNYVLVNYGETKVLTVDASSNASNITYQWYYSDSDTSEGGMIAGATGNNYTLTGNANLKYSYYCKVSDGINTVKTKKVYPELDTGLRVLNGDYMELKAQYGDKVEIEIEAVSTRPNITYKWYQCVDSDESNLELISTNSTSTYSYIASGSSYNYYKCVVSDGVMTKVVYIYVDYSGRIEDIAENFSATLEYSSIVEDGTAKKPIVTVRNDESTLEIDRHYTVEYKNNVKPGTATVVIKGIGRYKGEITKTFTITAKPATKPTQPTNPTQPTLTSISKATVTLSKKSYVFDGKAKKPSVKVVFNGKTLVKGTDYTVAYTKNKQIGKATVKVTGKGKYTGTVTKTFNINIKVGKTYTVGAYKYKVTSKSEVAFAGLKKANTKNVVIAGTVKIGGKKFKITSIVNNALKKKIKVKSVTIGANVKKIGKNAFSGCKNLKTITIKSTKLKSVGKNAFKGINSKAKIKVPKKKYNAYKKLLKAKGQPKNVKITK